MNPHLVRRRDERQPIPGCPNQMCEKLGVRFPQSIRPAVDRMPVQSHATKVATNYREADLRRLGGQNLCFESRPADFARIWRILTRIDGPIENQRPMQAALIRECGVLSRQWNLRPRPDMNEDDSRCHLADR